MSRHFFISLLVFCLREGGGQHVAQPEAAVYSQFGNNQCLTPFSPSKQQNKTVSPFFVTIQERQKLSLRQSELKYYTDNNNIIVQTTSLMAGFAFTAFSQLAVPRSPIYDPDLAMTAAVVTTYFPVGLELIGITCL